MSKLVEPLKIYPQVFENVRVTDIKAAQDDEAVQAAVKAVAEALSDTGRILVRESGTEPVVRVMVEAPAHDTCQKYVSQVVETIKSRGYAVLFTEHLGGVLAFGTGGLSHPQSHSTL